MHVLGAMLTEGWVRDPKRIAFTASRYKFVSKMFSGFGTVLEIGADSGYLSAIVAEQVGALTLCDQWPAEGVVAIDYTRDHLPDRFDGIYALDVLEHIDPEDEEAFLSHVCASLTRTGTLIIGMPSLESQVYASEPSMREHVNCKTEAQLRMVLRRHFSCVYLFGMNDETLHTGYGPMCQYRFAIANTTRASTKGV